MYLNCYTVSSLFDCFCGTFAFCDSVFFQIIIITMSINLSLVQKYEKI